MTEPDLRREIRRLRFDEHLGYATIAERLGLSLEQVKAVLAHPPPSNPEGGSD